MALVHDKMWCNIHMYHSYTRETAHSHYVLQYITYSTYTKYSTYVHTYVDIHINGSQLLSWLSQLLLIASVRICTVYVIKTLPSTAWMAACSTLPPSPPSLTETDLPTIAISALQDVGEAFRLFLPAALHRAGDTHAVWTLGMYV